MHSVASNTAVAKIVVRFRTHKHVHADVELDELEARLREPTISSNSDAHTALAERSGSITAFGIAGTG